PALVCVSGSLSLFFTSAAAPALCTLSLHDALPIFAWRGPLCCSSESSRPRRRFASALVCGVFLPPHPGPLPQERENRRRCRRGLDRKSTRLNSSHGSISYAVFRLKKQNRQQHRTAG